MAEPSRNFKPFYITGLPRSRTAWLSVVLSDYQRVSCLHEPLARTDPTNVEFLLTAQRTPFAGISDPGLSVVAPDLPELLPGPIVIVWRDPGEVIESIINQLGGSAEVHEGGIAALHFSLIKFANTHPHMDINFDDLPSMDVVRSIWSYLLPELPFQRRRIEQLQRLKIEADRSHPDGGIDESIREHMNERLQLAERFSH
jgi:hypothetical protein